MKSKNKKGFTLVELLAVIVILAVVILIAVTAVIPRMNKAKENAFVDEALVYIRAGKEAYISNETTECYDIADMGELVKQTKSGYSGTVYVNEKGAKVNLTNGKYYIIQDVDTINTKIYTSKPANFITSCSDTSKTYNISYDLGGGTLSATNPTTYTPNTSTITLNNPTKSGYRFVGWSSKNLFNKKTAIIDQELSGSNPSARKGWFVTSFIPIKYNTTYYISGKGYGANTVYINANKENINLVTGVQEGMITVPNNSAIYYVRLNGSTEKLDTFQLEEGSSKTDYQEYMEPTTTAKIYRGSTGNKKFIANWEAI